MVSWLQPWLRAASRRRAEGMALDVVGSVRRSPLTLPLATLAALLVFGINEAAYHNSSAALAALGDRGAAQSQIQSLWRGITEAESGQRGYLLTGRAEYRRPYDNAVDHVQESLQGLQRHFAGDAPASAILARIATLGREKLSELATALDLYHQGKHDAWRELMLTDIGREKMETLRALLEKLHATESANLEAERQTMVSTLRINRLGVNAMTALSLLALVLFRRQTLALDRAQSEHAMALQTERNLLEVEVVRRTADLTELAKHLQTAREDERSLLGRELHDELGALLTAAKLDAARLKRVLGTLSPEADARLTHLNQTINSGIELKRRIIEDLRPSSLSNLGLVAALEIQAREFAKRSELPVQTELQSLVLSDSAQITAYRLVQESLTNIAKYAEASSVSVRLQADGSRAHIAVSDNGKGFDPSRGRDGSHGLMGMRYRVEAEGGTMRVQSSPGGGTVVEAWLPTVAQAA